MTKIRKRHKWIENAFPVNSFPFEVYKVSQCSKCSLIRLHKLEGSNYSKSYLLGGIESDGMPECNN